MRLLHDGHDPLEIRGRDGARAPILVGLAFLFGPTLATLGAPAAMTGERLTAVLVLSAIGLGLSWLGWPRLHRVRIAGPPLSVEIDGKRVVPAAEASLLLAEAPPHHATGPARYGVVLAQPGAAPVLVLAGPHPDGVLQDLMQLAPRLALPVHAGWGLPRGTRWELGARPDAEAQSGPRPSPPMGEDAGSRGRIATSLLVGAAGVALVMMFEFRGRLLQGDAPALLGIVLPITMLTVLAVLALVVLRDEVRLDLGSALSFERRICGFSVARRTVPLSAIEEAYLISPGGQAPHHLLLATAAGPVAFPCDAEVGARLVAALSSGSTSVTAAAS